MDLSVDSENLNLVKRLNLIFSGLAIFLIVFSFFKNRNINIQDILSTLHLSSEQKKFNFESFEPSVRQKLNDSHQPPKKINIPGLTGISFDDYFKIKYKPEVAIWKNLALPFQLQFFHPGHIYNEGVKIYEIVDETPIEINYDSSRFDFGDLKLTDNFANYTKDLKHTGFRIQYPINYQNSVDEFCVFQGASYFRLISKNQVYGLSARGLSINTGILNQEEFPKFDTFYIKRPKQDDTYIQLFAKLESESVIGAYEFKFYPGEVTKAEVRAKIYLRKKIKRLGLTPLTSMFLYGESDKPIGNNFHPEIHDSDGLLLQTDTDEWEWRPLVNPVKVNLTEIETNQIRGYGLIQRDRKFKNYQDEFFKYHLRPSIWIKPISGFENGRIYLYEWPTLLDSDDNIGVFFEPKFPPNLKEGFEFRYELYLNDKSPPEHTLGKVSSFYKGFDPKTPNLQTYTLYFTGENLKAYTKQNPPIPMIQNNIIPKDSILYTMEKIPELDQWRLVFSFKPIVENSEWKVQLKSETQNITETWIYRDGISK